MSEKLYNIQALRAFAVLLVVLLHLLAVEGKYSSSGVLLPDFLRIGISGVDLFFVISGFIMVAVTGVYPLAATAERIGSARRFLILRVSRIYPLYWFVTALVLVIVLSQPGLANMPHFDLDVLYTLKSFLLLPQRNLPLVMVGWSLIHEMYFYLVFTALLLLPRKFLPHALWLWLVVVVIGYQQVDYLHPGQNPFARIAFSPVTVEFVTGCFLALYFEYARSHHRTPPVAMPALVSGLVALLVLWYFFSFDAQTLDVVGWTRVYLFTLPYALMVYGAVALETNGQRTAPPWAIRIGDHSYSIYLTHVLVLSLCGRIWKLFAWEGYLDNLLVLTVMGIAVIVVGAYCYRYVERPLLLLSRRLLLKAAP